MMRRRYTFAAATAAVLTACVTPYEASQPKLEQLNRKPPPIEQSGVIAPPQRTELEEGDVERAIENYRQILELSPDDPVVRVEAQRRLADLQVEVSELDPTAEDAGLVSTASSVALYEKLLAENPDSGDNDRIYYQKARAHQNRGELEAAINALGRLTAEYPDSALAGDAEFRRAELLFSIRRYGEAESGYAKVLKLGPDTVWFERTQYKYGWAMFKQERYADSVHVFLNILDRELPVGAVENLEATLAVVPRAQRELVKDVLRVVSLAFSYLGGGNAITEFLDGQPRRSYEPVLYANLAQLFIDKARYSDAARAYSSLADRSPTHPLAPLFQAEVINIYDQAGFADQVLKAKIEYVDRYDLDQVYWTAHSKEDSPEAWELLRLNMEQVASHWHANAQQAKVADRRRELYAEAATWYARYLDRFPGVDNVPQVNFLYAESLFESGRYELAALEYEKTAYEYGAHQQAPEAGYAAVLARHRLQTDADGTLRPEAVEESVRVSVRFADGFDRHPEVAAVLTRAAEDLFRIEQLDRSIEIATRVVQRDPAPRNELLVSAWSLISYGHYNQARYAEAEAGFVEALRLVPRGSERQREFSETLATAIYKQGELAQQAEQLEDAIRHFLRIKEVLPGSEIAASGDFDAAAVLIGMQDWARAAQVLNAFRAAYPGHRLQPEVTRKLAGVYLESGQPVLAAGEFKRIAASTAEPPEIRREASWQAAQLYDKADEAALAERAYEDHLRDFPQAWDQAFIAYEKLIAYTEARGDLAKNRYWMAALIGADQRAGANSTERSRYLAAQSSMVLAGDARRVFDSIRLGQPLNRSLLSKKKAMDKALAAYRDAANYAIAEFATEATYQIGSLYFRLAQELLDSPRPRGLSELELEQYTLLLEDQAYPLQDQAAEVHVINLGRIVEGIYDDWVQQSLGELAKIRPGRYDKAERSEVAIETLD